MQLNAMFQPHECFFSGRGACKCKDPKTTAQPGGLGFRQAVPQTGHPGGAFLALDRPAPQGYEFECQRHDQGRQKTLRRPLLSSRRRMLLAALSDSEWPRPAGGIFRRRSPNGESPTHECRRTPSRVPRPSCSGKHPVAALYPVILHLWYVGILSCKLFMP